MRAVAGNRNAQRDRSRVVNLILFEAGEVRDDGTVTLGDVRDVRAAHVRQVLRVQAGDDVRVGLIDGPIGQATIVAIDGERVELRCQFDAAVPPRPAVDLLLALPRPKVLRRLWAQLAALGVGQIVLTNALRVERDYFDAHVLQEAVYRPLLIEGLQQARDTRLPRVLIRKQFKPFVEDDLSRVFEPGARLVAHPGVERSMADIVHEQRSSRALLAIGPEGGWNDFELDLLRAHDFHTVSMGARVLRADTACIALLALLHDALRPSTTISFTKL
jgi:16S rRNA (uracil1498-N3)-methyltransferase